MGSLMQNLNTRVDLKQPYVIVLLGVVGIGLLTEFTMDVLWKARYYGWGDFRVYYISATALNTGQDIYDTEVLTRIWLEKRDPQMSANFPHFFSYPPLFATMLRPLTFFPIVTAARIWVVINAFLWVICLFFLCKFLDLKPDHVLFWILFFVALRYEPVLTNLTFGQINLLVFLFCLGSLIGLKHKIPSLAGFCLAFAIMLKLVPLVLLGYYLFRKHFRIVLWTAVFWVLILAVSCSFVDFSVHVQYVTQALPILSKGFKHPYNQSIFGWFLRLFEAANLSDHANWAHAISRIISILLVFITFRNLWHRPYPAPGYTPDEISLCILLTCLGSPVTWSHHLVWVIIPFACIFRQISETTVQPGIFALILLVYALVGVVDDYYVHPMFLSGPLVLLSSIKLYGLLVLFVFLLKNSRGETVSLSGDTP